ncbi:MAG: plasmid recombination protein [Oscillospiraceae bacterium]|nr:plasmid recombination protein [Oscillospiraceae bacterium]
MAHVQKYSMSAAGNLCAHYERAKDADGNFIRFNNQEIDPTKTFLNYNLAPKHPEGQMEFIKKRISEVKILNRANVNVMCSWLLTLPKDFMPEDQFFIESYRFMAKRYMDENIVSAYVHKDEKQPHMHFSFIPIKDGKVIAKEVLNRIELSRFHPELKVTLDRVFGRDVAVLSDVAGRGPMGTNASTIGLSVEVIEALKLELEELTSLRDTIQADIDKKIFYAEVMEQDEATLQQDFSTITYERYKELVNTAKYVNTVQQQLTEKEMEISSLGESISALRETLKSNPTLAMVGENSLMRTRLTNLENRLVIVLANAPPEFQPIIRNILNDRDPFTGLEEE